MRYLKRYTGVSSIIVSEETTEGEEEACCQAADLFRSLSASGC